MAHSGFMNMSDSLIVSSDAPQHDGDFQRVQREDVLAPGYYWRAKRDFVVKSERQWGSGDRFQQDDCHLLLDVFEYEGAPHSVEVLEHPRRGTGIVKIMVAEFLENMEPAYDAEQVRRAEQQEILDSVQQMQDEMAEAQSNPLLLPDVRAAADKAVEEFERKVANEALVLQTNEENRQKDLRRIHRRAARRSEAAGNPLVVKNVTISTELGDMIRGGVNSEGLGDLTLEARRRTAIAEASANWLTSRVRQLSDTLQSLSPFYAEKGRVALARAKKAIAYSKTITNGLESLKLYTGDSVHVVTVVEGKSASTEFPLTIFQSKRFMDEELAVFTDVGEEFDWSDQERFFRELGSSAALRDHLLPMPRCAISMAVRRRDLSYEGKDSIEALRNNLENRRVFLLIRDGENVHAVYSTEPSHEYAERLFPTSSDIHAPFKGINGTDIRLDEVAFIKAKDTFEAQALHYKRFLILLCGLDHRMRLMGEFYPPEKSMEFMSESFQAKYFYFVEDDDSKNALGGEMLPILSFLTECNKKISSGSRVVVGADVGKHCPSVERSHAWQVDYANMPSPLVAAREGKRHYVTVPTCMRYRNDKGSAKAWLESEEGEVGEWFLCVDSVDVETLRRYVFNRGSRAISISWIRSFKNAIQLLEADLAAEEPLRAYLTEQAVQHAGLSEEEVPALMHKAICTWRVSHRGAPAPTLDQKKAVNEVLTLMYPADRVAQSSEALIDAFVTSNGWTPLRLVRTGKTGMTLYVEADAADRAPYPQAMQWRWVKRVRLEFKKSGVSVKDAALVWLLKDRPVPGEIEIRRWEGFDSWLNEGEETASLKHLLSFAANMEAATVRYGALLSAGRAQIGLGELDIDLMEEIRQGVMQVMRSLKNGRHPRIRIPVGIWQSEDGAPVAYLYAAMSARRFVKRYGKQDQYAEIRDAYARCGFRNFFDSDHPQIRDSEEWLLVQTNKPLDSLIMLNDDSVTLCKSVNREIQLGGKSRGWAYANKSTVHQSWNRAVETLKGIAPHLKREFYEELREEIKHAKNFGVSIEREERRENVRKAVAKRHVVTGRSVLSTLLWDESKKRSHAGKYFSLTNAPKAVS